MSRRPLALGYLDLPPMLARPLDTSQLAFAPAFAHLADLNRQVASARWLFDNDPEETT